MAIGDIYRVVMNYIWNPAAGGGSPQPCSNVFYYRLTATTALKPATELQTAFGQDVLPSLIAIAPSTVEFTGHSCLNTADMADFYEAFYTANGGRAVGPDHPLSPVNNLTFVSQSPRPRTRSARKRFPFLVETDVNGKVIDLGAIGVALVNSAANAMENQISYGTSTAVPVVARKGATPTAPYTEVYPITQYDPKTYIASQDTRRG